MITLSLSNNGKYVYIKTLGDKRTLSFPKDSIAYFKDNEIKIISTTVQAIPSFKFAISELDAANSNPSFSKETSQSLSNGLDLYFTLSKSWLVDIGISDPNTGGGSGSGGTTIIDVSNADILKFKAWLIREFGNDIDVMEVYRNLVLSGDIRAISVLE